MSEPVAMTSASKEPLPQREQDELEAELLRVQLLEDKSKKAFIAMMHAEDHNREIGQALYAARVRVAELLEKRL